MEAEFITLYSYSNHEDATDAILVLKKHGINYEIDDSTPSLDPFFAYNTAAYSIHLKVREEDAARSLELISSSLAENVSKEIREVTSESLMEKYSNEELKEVIRKKDEWDADDMARAERILKVRGITITQEEKEHLWQQRLQETRQPQKGSTGWIILGFAVALMGGLFGLAIGASYLFLKKNDMHGYKHYMFDRTTRMWGLAMVLTGIAVLAITLSYFDYWYLELNL